MRTDRNFESVVLALAERGHSVHLAADERESLGGAALVERLAAGRPGITLRIRALSRRRAVVLACTEAA